MLKGSVKLRATAESGDNSLWACHTVIGSILNIINQFLFSYPLAMFPISNHTSLLTFNLVTQSNVIIVIVHVNLLKKS